ncbi:MAG: DUF4296 domain-containing protein [Chitinophagaceae bacterium]|nr:DUF4296 domain-containing protein [Chitinophagaceae bacterium]
MKRMLPAIVILFIFGCTNTTKIPNDILSKQKMQVVLWDIVQAERFSAVYLLKDSLTKNMQLEKFKLYEQIFYMHKVSREDFIKSYKYYLRRPDMAKAIFDSIDVKAQRQKENNYKSAPVK